jgi:sialate O-acetylesterase
MTVTVDVGSIGIHPPNKLDVGHRLALTALKVAYGQEVVHSGPSYAAMHVEGGKIRVRFQNTGSGLVLMNPPGQREQPAPTRLAGFAIAGEDRHFQWAEAVIDGDSVVAWNERIEHPVAVRYAWNNQPQVNLYNRESLPAVPFRTDQWPWTPPMHSPSQ